MPKKKKQKKRFEDYTEEELIKYRHNFVKATLRRSSYRWPYRTIALTKARVSRGIYECNLCKSHIKNKEKKLDHIEPVVDPKTGFVNWDEFADRLLCRETNFQVICLNCHSSKTKLETELRKYHRKQKKLLDKKRQKE